MQFCKFHIEINSVLGIHQIAFNPVAPTSMVKTLQNIIQLESKINSKCVIPDKNTLNSLATNSQGDIRAAINALQFACRTTSGGSLQKAFQSHSSLESSSSTKKKRKRPEKFLSKNR